MNSLVLSAQILWACGEGGHVEAEVERSLSRRWGRPRMHLLQMSLGSRRAGWAELPVLQVGGVCGHWPGCRADPREERVCGPREPS